MKRILTTVGSIAVLQIAIAADAPFGGAGGSGHNGGAFDATECIEYQDHEGQDRLLNKCNKPIAASIVWCGSGGSGSWGQEYAGHVCDDSASSSGWVAYEYASQWVLDPGQFAQPGYAMAKASGTHFEFRWAACITAVSSANLDGWQNDKCAALVDKLQKLINTTGKSPKYLWASGQIH